MAAPMRGDTARGEYSDAVLSLPIHKELALHAAALRPSFPQIHARDRSPPPPPPAPGPPTRPQAPDEAAQEEEEEVHEGDGQEVAERGQQQGPPGPPPVRHAVDVRLALHVAAPTQLVQGREQGVGHPEHNGVDGVQEAGGGGGDEEIEEDVDGVDGVEGHPHRPQLLVAWAETGSYFTVLTDTGPYFTALREIVTYLLV